MANNTEYAFESDGYVSVWYGYFPAEADFIDYLITTYTKEGEAVSTFLSEFPFQDFEEDFSERYFFEDISEGMSEISFIDSFSAELLADFHSIPQEGTNALFFVYDYNAGSLIHRGSTMKLLGVYEYELNNEEWNTLILS